MTHTLHNEVTASTDCQSCAACCRFPWTVDAAPIGISDLTEADADGRPVMVKVKRGDEQRCIALDEQCGRFACAIYDERPDCCRRFEPGSAQCRRAVSWLAMGEALRQEVL